MKRTKIHNRHNLLQGLERLENRLCLTSFTEEVLIDQLEERDFYNRGGTVASVEVSTEVSGIATYDQTPDRRCTTQINTSTSLSVNGDYGSTWSFAGEAISKVGVKKLTNSTSDLGKANGHDKRFESEVGFEIEGNGSLVIDVYITISAREVEQCAWLTDAVDGSSYLSRESLTTHLVSYVATGDYEIRGYWFVEAFESYRTYQTGPVLESQGTYNISQISEVSEATGLLTRSGYTKNFVSETYSVLEINRNSGVVSLDANSFETDTEVSSSAIGFNAKVNYHTIAETQHEWAIGRFTKSRSSTLQVVGGIRLVPQGSVFMEASVAINVDAAGQGKFRGGIFQVSVPTNDSPSWLPLEAKILQRSTGSNFLARDQVFSSSLLSDPLL